MKKKYRVDDDGYIICDDNGSCVIVCEMYPEHVQALTKIVESHDDLLAACKCSLADLEGIMPIHEPLGDRLHPAWQTIKELRQAIAKAE